MRGSGSVVERCLAKANVASSNLVSRSIRHHSQAVRQRSAKPLRPSSNLGGASIKLESSDSGFFNKFILPEWRNRQTQGT